MRTVVAALTACGLAAGGLVTVAAAPAVAAAGDLIQTECISQAPISGCTTALPPSLGGAAALSMDAANVYVASLTSGSITTFTRGVGGALTQTGCISQAPISGCTTAPQSSLGGAAALSMDAANVYVTGYTSNAVTTFTRGIGGELTQTGCVSHEAISGCTTAPQSSLARPVGVSMDAANVYVTSEGTDSVTTFTRGAGGALTQTGCISQEEISGCTTAAQSSLNNPNGVSVDAANVYVTSRASGSVTTFTRGVGGELAQTGCISQAVISGCTTAPQPSLNGAVGVSMDAANLYVASSDSDSVTTFTRGAGGELTQTGCISQAVISGCTTAPQSSLNGAFGVTMDAANAYVASLVSSAVTTFGITAAPVFTSADNTSATSGSAMNTFTVTTTGNPTPTLSNTGALPSGVSFTDNGDGSATITGTPADGSAGPWPIMITATNGVSPDATQAFILTVAAPAPTPTPSPSPQIPVGGCVATGGTNSIPTVGTKTLMKPSCVTNARQAIGVAVTAKRRGDMRPYSLHCKKSNGKTTKTRATGYGDGSRYCKKGALKIRTYGQHLRLRVSWSAPATSTYTAYARTKTYLT